MFNVGDLITGTSGTHYGITNNRSLCVVTKVNNSTDIYVKVIGHTWEDHIKNTDYENDDYGFRVSASYFIQTTMEEYKAKYPNAYFLSDEEIAKLIPDYQSATTTTTTTTKKEEIIMNHMNKTETYTLTVEERQSLHCEIMDLLTDLPSTSYNPSDSAINAIIDEWVKNKGWMINLFKKHPNYNGNYQIAFDADFNRVCDKNILYSFKNYLRSVIAKPQEVRRYCCTYSEMISIYKKLNNVADYMSYIISKGYSDVRVNGRNFEETLKEKLDWNKKILAMQRDKTLYVDSFNGRAYDQETYNLYNNSIAFANYIPNYTEHIATEEYAKQINAWFPTIKAVAGQKTSRIVGKVCKLLGVDKHPDYNREFAKYSDAINPLVIKRHTIFSCHPVDYLTMSFGNSWNSCHDIGHMDVGCYSSGTLSYMLDESSFVFYTVDKDYDGDAYELQDKINRNMFHIGEDKLIQARVYPQTTDGETGMYRQIREVAQKVIADCLEMPNMWKNVKGTSECCKNIDSYGTHYTDYEYFDDCNVSYLKTSEEDLFNKARIKVGHSPICPSCGTIHSHEGSIECYECYNDEVRCACCGDYHDREYMRYIDGEWYCDDCCFYCDYHNEYETGEYYRVNGSGDRICEAALEESDRYAKCEYCGNVDYLEDMIETEDGHFYCDSDHAEADGYTETSEDGWYPDDKVCYCEHCDRYVHIDDWNSELQCCTMCEDEVAAENADDESEEKLEEEVA